MKRQENLEGVTKCSKKRMILRLVVFAVLLIMVSPIIKIGIEQKILDKKYNAINEILSGNEVTIIAADYVNATIVSEEWNEEILTCIEKDTVRTGMFAGQSKKEYYVFKGIKAGKTEIVFIVDEFGASVRKTYEAEVSENFSITVCPTGKEKLEDANSKKHSFF